MRVPENPADEVRQLRAQVAEYENAITWGTSCLSCAAVLDSSIRETNRADDLRALLAEILGAVIAPSSRSKFYRVFLTEDEYASLRARAGITGQPIILHMDAGPPEKPYEPTMIPTHVDVKQDGTP